jgi:hypothetical protein
MDALSGPVISRLPWGLLGFLGLKNGGQYPRGLEANVRTTFDQLGPLVGNHAENAVISTTVAAPAYTTLFTVTNGEVWYLDNVACFITAGAGEAWSGTISMNIPGTAPAYFGPLHDEVTLGASAQTVVWTRGLWLPPGAIIGLHTHTVTGTIDLFGTIRFLRMPV